MSESEQVEGANLSYEVFVALASNQLTRLVDFYSALLIPPKVCTTGYAEFRLPGLKLAIFVPKASHTAEFSLQELASETTTESVMANSGPMSLCLEVKEIERAIATLTQLGYPPRGPLMSTSHGQEIYAYDPDGNRLILHQSKTDNS